jgi:predicted transcriptional regulator
MMSPSASTLVVMSTTVQLPDDLAERLAAEAARRGISVDEVAVEALAARYPQASSDRGRDALEAFIGSASGRHQPFDIRKARAELAEGA